MTTTEPADVSVTTAIVGAGPCGLGAAWRLANSEGAGRFVVIDRGTEPGGSAASVTTPEGFLFDYGGHVLFPHEHYSGFLELLDDLVPDWHASVPIRGVWIDGRLVPYPIQRNIHRLRFDKMIAALVGLARVRLAARFRAARATPNLGAYLRQEFGTGLTRVALGPMNRKMWAHDPERLDNAWTSQRSGSKVANVAGVRLRDLLRRAVTREDAPGWSPETTVRYPATGGSGSIWTALAAPLREHLLLGDGVVRIDDQARALTLASGKIVRYERLISTLPLDVLLDTIVDNDDLVDYARQLRFATAAFYGFGITGRPPERLRGVHSFHVVGDDMPCWRITLPSNFAPGNAPAGSWSILCEQSVPGGTEIDLVATRRRIQEKLFAYGIVAKDQRVVSEWTEVMHHGYPVPFLGRDAVLRKIHIALARRGIVSRGRFGGWKYEVSNQDHTFMQGVEAVDFLLSERAETTYRLPEFVN